MEMPFISYVQLCLQWSISRSLQFVGTGVNSYHRVKSEVMSKITIRSTSSAVCIHHVKGKLDERMLAWALRVDLKVENILPWDEGTW